MEPRRCVGTLRHSAYKACYLIYVGDAVGQIPHSYIEISYAALPSADKKVIIQYAKRMALSKGINLVEVY